MCGYLHIYVKHLRILCKEVTRDFIQKPYVSNTGEYETKVRRDFFGIPNIVFLNHANFALWVVSGNV